MSFYSAKNDISGSTVDANKENEYLTSSSSQDQIQSPSSMSFVDIAGECFSSDDSVCWGPYTIEEAKKDAKRLRARPITQRHSSISRFQYLDLNKEIDTVTTQFADISSNPSEYVTSNDTLEISKSKNSDFLHKLEEVINEPVSGHTSYNTAIEHTHIDNICRNTSYNRTFDQTNAKISVDNQQKTDYIELDNSKHTCDGENHQDTSPNDSIIYISDDSSSQLNTSDYEFVNQESTSPVVTYLKEEAQELIKEGTKDDDSFVGASEYYYVNEEKKELEEKIPENSFKNLRHKLDFNCLSKISENTEYTTSQFVNQCKFKINDTSHKDISDSFAIDNSFINESSENQFNISTSPRRNDSFATESSEDKVSPSPSSVQTDLKSHSEQIDFDDTLEEINRFLAQGSDYEMPEKTVPNKNSPSNNYSSITGSFMNNREDKFPALETKIKQDRNFYSKEKISKPATEIKSSIKPKFESKIKPPSVTKLGNKSANPVFKLPSNRPLIKTPNKMNNLKNVVSPVGVYIKNTPKFCPMIKVAAHNKTKLELSKLDQPGSSSSQKENIPASLNLDQIPAVIYKPSKTQIATEVNHVKLPQSIKKLVSPQVVTKHERRIGTEMCNESIQRRLMESDFSINESNLDITTGDVSILTHNQPYNLKKY